MMADGPAEVGVAPPTDPTVETICALVFGGEGGGRRGVREKRLVV